MSQNEIVPDEFDLDAEIDKLLNATESEIWAASISIKKYGNEKGATAAAELVRTNLLLALKDHEIKTLNEQLAQRTWIKCSERMPTEEDGDKNRKILWYLQCPRISLWNSRPWGADMWQRLPPDPEED